MPSLSSVVRLGRPLPLLLLTLASSPRLAGQADSVVVAPGPRYEAGWFHRFWLGDTHRDLWTTPIQIPVLDLAGFEGGLSATERGGSAQTRSLRFRAASGKVFVFRALDKDPTQTWPPEVRRSPIRHLAEDQTSALLPTGALVVGGLEEAAGLLGSPQRLVVLPDDPRLGEWRREFGGMAGLLEERVRGDARRVAFLVGARDVISTDALYTRLAASGTNQVDARRFLAARLFDIFVGDWDRHADQWSWARFDEGSVRRWVPVPRDRDWALARLDGPLYGLLRVYMPKYQTFESDYGSVYGMTLNAEALDRRLLVSLGRPVWDSIVKDLTSRLSDTAIENALTRLPAEYQPIEGARLAKRLRSRRDQLPRAAQRFYRQLTGTVDLRGTEGPDRAEVVREADGSVSVAMSSQGRPTLARRFDADETRELRIDLLGGNDSVLVAGTGPDRITVRVVGGDGADAVVDQTSGGGLSLYDPDGGAGVNARRFISPVPANSPVTVHRDWGHLWTVVPWVELGPEIGLFVGGGPVVTRYGFRRVPYRSRLTYRAGFATDAGGLNLDVAGDFRFEDPAVRLTARAATLGIDVVRYFGFGNETPRTQETGFYRVLQREHRVESAVERRAGRYGSVGVGVAFTSSSTDLDHASLLAVERPYGSGSFTETALIFSAGWDSRDQIAYPTHGSRFKASAEYFPGIFDVRRSFGSLEAEGATYLTASRLPLSPTLALRAGAKRLFGTFPFFEAAAIGGKGTVRGLSSQRHIGRSAVHASAEVRLALGGFSLLLPGEWGLFGLSDVGRVYQDGERSTRWHSAIGGGLWFAFLDRRSTVSITFASSEEQGRLYAGAGFQF